MRNNKCEHCGANINIKTMSCEYCGANYTVINKSATSASGFGNILQGKTIISLNDNNIVAILNKLNPSFMPLLPVFVFMAVWCSITLGMGFFAIGFAGFVGIVPLLMFVVGLSVLISTVKNVSKNRINSVVEACKTNRWTEALQICEQNETHNNNYKLAYILIKVHHFKDYEKVDEKIASIPILELSKSLMISPVWGEIAELYGRKIDNPLSSSFGLEALRNYNNHYNPWKKD